MDKVSVFDGINVIFFTHYRIFDAKSGQELTYKVVFNGDYES